MKKALLLLSILALVSPLQAAEPTIVYLTRHAEKIGSGPDPKLSGEGKQRVATLQKFFDNIEIDGFYASQFNRTQETVEALAFERDQEVQVVLAQRPDIQVQTILDQPGQTFVVAGHSNTVPWLLELLGGPVINTIGEDDYSNLYQVIVSEEGEVTVNHFRLDP